jgi:hypothetical protein
MEDLDRRQILALGGALLLGGVRIAAAAEPPAPPADWPESYRRAVAIPELHVFRPQRPNGRAVLVMPGGAYWFVSVVNEGADSTVEDTPLGVLTALPVHAFRVSPNPGARRWACDRARRYAPPRSGRSRPR